MKMIWALNLFGKDCDLVTRSAAVLEAVTRHHPATIQPVMFFSQLGFFSFQAPCPAPPAEMESRVAAAAKDRLSDLIRRFDLKDLEPVRLILRRFHPLRAEVNDLLRFAHDEKADVIVTATRARTGWRRLMSGSFTESLIFKSDIPFSS